MIKISELLIAASIWKIFSYKAFVIYLIVIIIKMMLPGLLPGIVMNI